MSLLRNVFLWVVRHPLRAFWEKREGLFHSFTPGVAEFPLIREVGLECILKELFGA